MTMATTAVSRINERSGGRRGVGDSEGGWWWSFMTGMLVSSHSFNDHETMQLKIYNSLFSNSNE